MLTPALLAQNSRRERKPDLILENEGIVARVTGKTQEWENYKNPNHTDKRWNLGGTDLGVIWETEPGKYALAFGDSYGKSWSITKNGGPSNPDDDWRSNVLAFTENTDLENGLVFTGMMHDKSDRHRAAPIIEREDFREFTYIPTGAIELNGVQYMHYMYWEVFHRELADRFYGSFCRSFDGGHTWENCNDQIRFSSESYFGMVALAKKPGDDYCYMLGARTGRGYRRSVGKLARFTYDNILNKDEYEYWDGEANMWVKGDEHRATTLIEGTVGEASLMYMEKYDKWLAIYIDSRNGGISYRSADNITGPWSQSRPLIKRGEIPGCYGSFIHPACAKDDDGHIYWTMSIWGYYNVFLMKSSIRLDEEIRK